MYISRPGEPPVNATHLLLAPTLSLVLPGSGHIYLGYLRRGLALFTIYFMILAIITLQSTLLTFNGFIIGTIVILPLHLYIILNSINICITDRSTCCNMRKSRVLLIFAMLTIASALSIADILPFDNLQSYKIRGQHMSPTLTSGDLIIVSSDRNTLEELAVGDVVIVNIPDSQNMMYIVRITGICQHSSTNYSNGAAQNSTLQLTATHTNYVVNIDNPVKRASMFMPRTVTSKDITGKALYVYFSTDISKIGADVYQHMSSPDQ